MAARKQRSMVPWMFIRLTAVVLAALLAGASLLYAYARRQQLDLSYGANMDLLQQASHTLDSMLESVAQNALLLAQNEGLTQLLHFDHNSAAAHLSVRNQMEALRNTMPIVDSIYLIRYANRRVLASGSQWGTGYFALDALADPLVLSSVHDGRQTGWLLPRSFPDALGTPLQYVSYCLDLPIESSAKEGKLVVNLRVDALRRLFTKATGPLSGLVQIVSNAGVPILGALEAEGADALRQALEQPAAQGRLPVRSAEEDYYLFYARSGYLDWVYFVTVPAQALSAPALRLLGWTFLVLLLSSALSAALLYTTSLRVIRPIRNLIRRLDGSQAPDQASPFSELTAIEASWRALHRQNLAYAGEVSDQRAMRRRNAMIALLLGQPCDQEMIDAARAHFEGCVAHQVAVVDLAGTDAARWEAVLVPWKGAAVCMALSLSPIHLALLIGWRKDAPDAGALEALLSAQAQEAGCILGLGLPRGVLGQLHDSYREATAMLDHAKQEGKPFLSYRTVSARDGVRRGYRKYDEMTRRMSERIAERDVPAARQLVRQFFSSLDLDSALRPSDRKMLELQMANTLWLSVSDSLREGLAPDAYEVMYLRSDGAAIHAWAADILELLSQEAGPSDTASLVGQRILEYVDQAYRRPLGLEDTAARFHMGTTTFCGLFKEITGSTFADHLTGLRLNEACRLLRETEAKVQDVAEQSGFGNQQNMLRAFRKLLGTTPVKYRGLHAQGQAVPLGNEQAQES